MILTEFPFPLLSTLLNFKFFSEPDNSWDLEVTGINVKHGALLGSYLREKGTDTELSSPRVEAKG